MADAGFLDQWPTYDDKAVTGDKGVAFVQVAATRDLGWAFRSKPTIDLGIDGELEVRNADGTSTGRVMSMQIKCGQSYLRASSVRGFRYRPKPEHLNYWLSHTTPVLLVLVDDSTGTCYWQHVTAENLTIVDGVSIIEVPFDQCIDEASRWNLARIAEGFQQIDLVRQLFRVWLVESSMFTYSWNNELQIPRDFHGMDLWMPSLPGRGVVAADVVLGRPGFGSYERAELEDIFEHMRRNQRVAACDHALIGLVSGNIAALTRDLLPVPPEIGERGLVVEYVPLLLREGGPYPSLVEVGPDGELIDDDYNNFLILSREAPDDIAANEANRRASRMWGSL